MDLATYFRDQYRRLDKLDDASALFQVIERWSMAIDNRHPMRCGQGCSACCRSETIPRASVSDWSILHAHLLTLPQERQAAFLARNRERYGPWMPQLLKQVRHDDGPPAEVSLPAENPCVFLEDGRCGVYEARPLICRMFGYFFHPGVGQVMTCGPGTEFLKAGMDAGGEWVLPDVTPIFAAWGRLSRYPDAPLPVWLLAHDLGDGLDPQLQTDPDFGRLAERI